MKKVLLGTLIGFLLFGAGIFIGFYAIESIKNGGSALLILGSIIFCGGGLFILYKAGRMDTFKSKIVPLKIPLPKEAKKIKKSEKVSNLKKGSV